VCHHPRSNSMRNGNGIMGRTNPNRYTDLGDNLIHFNEVGITCSAKEAERIKQRRELSN
jgi:hypothetical protein